MNDIQIVYDFLKAAGTYYLATVDETEVSLPHVRPFGTVNLFEGKLYIQTGKIKPTAKQLLVNPRAEISAMKDGTWVRISATLLPDERVEAKKAMLDAYPHLRSMYDENDKNTVVFCLTQARAIFYSFESAPRTYFFGMAPMKSVEEITDDEHIHALPQVLQGAYPDLKYPTHTEDGKTELGDRSTFQSSGCGLASSMMAANFLLGETGFTANDAVRLSLESGSSCGSGTHYLRYAPAFAEKFGLFTKFTDSEEELSAWLKEGYCAVAHCRNNTGDPYARVFTKGGHYVFVCGESKDGRPMILDPAFSPDKYEHPGRKEKVELVRGINGIFTLVSYETLAVETAPASPRKYILFRKK